MISRVSIDKFNGELYNHIKNEVKDFQNENKGYHGVEIDEMYFYLKIKELFTNYKYDNTSDSFCIEIRDDAEKINGYKGSIKINLDLMVGGTREYIRKELNLILEERKDKISCIASSKNSRVKVCNSIDNVIKLIVKEHPELNKDLLVNDDNQAYRNIFNELELNLIGIHDRKTIELEEYKIWDVENEELQTVIAKHINIRRDILLDDLKVIEICNASEKNLKDKFVSIYENIKKDTDLGQDDFISCFEKIKSYVIKENNIKPRYTFKGTYYDFTILNENMVNILAVSSTKFVNNLEYEKEFIEKSKESGIDLSLYINDKIENLNKEGSEVYASSSTDCFAFIENALLNSNELNEKKFAKIEYLIINNESYIKFDISNDDTKSYVNKLFGRYISHVMYVEAQSNNNEVISFRFANILKKRMKGLKRKNIYFKDNFLTYNLYDNIRKILKSDAKYNSTYVNDEFIINDKELEKVFSDYKFLDKALSEHSMRNILVSEDYEGEYLTSNCLIPNALYDEAYIYCNLVGGAEVFREHGKLCLKVSKNAEDERKLKSSEIEERLKSTYQLDKNKCFIYSFDDNNTINSTNKKFSPYVHADNYIDKVTLENCKNTAMDITYNNDVDETCFPTTYALLNEISNNKEVEGNRLVDNTAYYLQNKESSDVQLLLHGVYGDAVEILYGMTPIT